MKRILLSLFILTASIGSAFAQASFTAKDAAGATQTFKSFNCTANICSLAVPADSTGAAFGVTGNPFFVTNNGTFAVQLTGATNNINNVSGTVSLPTGASTAAKQPALGTAGTASVDVLTVQGIAAMTPLLVTLSGTNNINNISGTISLPTGAATAAKQPALGTAGSASTDVLTVQGIASMTPFLTNPGTAANWGVGTSTQNSATVANGHLALAQFNTTPTTITTGNMSPLQMDSAGNLLVNIKAGAAAGGTSSNFGSAFPAAGTAMGLTDGTNMVAAGATTYGTTPTGKNAMAVNAFVTNANANGQTTMSASSPVTIASDQSAVATKAASGAYASGSLASGAVVDITNMSVATGSAPPSKAVYLGANASGATGGQVAGLITCDKHVFKHITTATDTLAVQGVASQTIRICGWRSRAAGVATWFLENTASVNANCASANTQITGVATEAANTGETMLAPFWTGLANTSGNGLCINSTGTGGVDIDIWYNQF